MDTGKRWFLPSAARIIHAAFICLMLWPLLWGLRITVSSSDHPASALWLAVFVPMIVNGLAQIRVIGVSPSGIESISVFGVRRSSWHALTAAQQSPGGGSFLHPAGYHLHFGSGSIVLPTDQQHLEELLDLVARYTFGGIVLESPGESEEAALREKTAGVFEYTVRPSLYFYIWAGAALFILAPAFLIARENPIFGVVMIAAGGVFLWNIWSTPVRMRFRPESIELKYLTRTRVYRPEDLRAIKRFLLVNSGTITLVFQDTRIAIHIQMHIIEPYVFIRVLKRLYPHIEV